MELQIVKPREEKVSGIIDNLSNNLSEHQQKKKTNPFIEANTTDVSLSHLSSECIIPVFSKDNEKTIAHQEFIQVVQECIQTQFSGIDVDLPEIRVSHQIKGRVPSAIHKPAKELLDSEKTQYWERMAFIIRIPGITETINGNKLSLVVGGVRAYNQENLYSKKGIEKFKFFIGFQNLVCCNLCVSTDGFKEELRVTCTEELQKGISSVISSYSLENDLKILKQLPEHSLTEKQFAQLIGKAKLYQYLPKEEKVELPQFLMNDTQISTIAKDYYEDKSFCRNENGEINLWDVFNLFTSANKSSYIDTFLNRNVSALNFSEGLCRALNGDSEYAWFLN